MIIEVCPRCGADLEHLTYTTYPPIHAHICRNCGWQQEEREDITRVSIATVNRKKPTNLDRIRAMSEDELAWFYAEKIASCYGCESSTMEDCYKCWLDWLKSSVNNGNFK